MFLKRIAFLIFSVCFSCLVNASVWDTLFPPKPFKSEEEALIDAKKMLKYASQCRYVSCTSSSPKGGPADKPIRSCRLMKESQTDFFKRYKVSPNRIKTKHVSWYIDKRNHEDRSICD